MKKVLLFFFIFLFKAISAVLIAQDEIEISAAIGEWEYTYTSPISIDANSDNSNSHYISIYTAEEIGSATFLDGLSWYKKGNTPGYLDEDGQLKIYFKHTSLDSIPTELGTYESELLDASQVYESNEVSIPLLDLWLNYQLDTGFAYNGIDNLMILVEWYMPGDADASPGLGQFWGKSTNGKGAMWRGNSFDSLSYFTSSTSGDRPFLRLNTADPYDVGLYKVDIPNQWNGSEPIDLLIYNAGYNTLENFTIQSWINGVMQDDYLWTGSIAHNDTTTIPFTSDPMIPGFYQFNLISELPNDMEDGDYTNDSLQFYTYSCDGPLSGTYTVGPGNEFETLLEISYALNICGIEGDVYFSFLPGIYSGQLSLQAIVGSSENNSVFFYSENGNSSSVIWEYASEDEFDNWIVNINNCSYMQFKDITLHATGNFDYSRLIVLHNGSNNIEINSCQLIGFNHNSFCGSSCGNGESIYISAIDGDTIYDISITDNFFKYNLAAVYVTSNEDYAVQNVLIEDNILRDQYRYGIFAEWTDTPIIRSNHIRTISSYSYSIEGIELINCKGAFEISANDILVSRDGITINSCIGEEDDYGMVFNNFVYIDDLTCAESGLILTLSRYVKLLHNTISNYDECDSGNGALFIRGSDYVVKNNIFNSRNSEKAISMGSYFFGSAMTNYDADYNMLSGSPIAYVGQVDYDLEGWQNFSGADDFSFVESPDYIFAGELHLASLPSTLGAEQSDVLYDIDGEERDTLNPVVGADEIPACIGPLYGVYYIGEGEEYQSIRVAIASLISCGVDGPVDMRIKSGVYDEQIDLYPIPGASLENRIRFISDNEDHNDVIIRHEEPQDHAIAFTQASFIRFEEITISAKGIGVSFNAGSKHNSISNCKISVDSVFVSKEVSEALSNTCISIYGIGCDSNRVEYCSLNYGLYGVHLYGPYAERPFGNEIIGNTLKGQNYFGILGKYADNILIRSNEIIDRNDEDYSAINFNHVNGSQIIVQNKIDISGLGNKYGIYSVYADIDTISNNFIHIKSIEEKEIGGMFFKNCSPLVAYNSIHIEGLSNDSSYCANTWIASFADYYNNIFSNSSGGYSLIVKGESSSNYNQYSTTKENHIKQYSGVNSFWERDLFLYNYWTDNGDNSIEETVNFVSNDDLHIISSALGGNADTSIAIYIDIDNEARDEIQPDFGADEYGIRVQEEYYICEGDSIWIGANEGATSYVWDNGDTTAMIKVSPAESNEYFLEVVFENDTTDFTILVNVTSLNLPELSDSVSICDGDEITLYYPGDFDTWLWSNGSVIDSTLASEAGYYYVSVSKNSCSATDSSFITVNANPIPDLGEDQSIGMDDSITLVTAEEYISYEWHNGSMEDSFSLVGNNYRLGDNLFWVEVVDENGCIGRDSVIVTVSLVDEIRELERYSLTLSPNPAQNQISIESQNIEKVEIINAYGAKLFSKITSANSIHIDVEDWAEGVYILRIRYEDTNIQTRKFIKL